jgi:hypothetical protein
MLNVAISLPNLTVVTPVKPEPIIDTNVPPFFVPDDGMTL